MPEPTFDHNKKPIEPSAQTEAGEKGKDTPSHPLADLQRQVGNRAVQQLIQRSGGQGPTELDEDTAGRIERARGGGQELESGTKDQMSQAMGYDFSEVNVHTSPESDQLNHQVGAEAFTTGNDIFFREGAYDPATEGGQELIAHELTHVVQQGTGQTGGSGGAMTVNAPGDAHEKEADAVAQAVTGPGSEAVQKQGSDVQLQEVPEEEEEIAQMQEDEELLQMQEMPEEEELLQTQPLEEEEEMLMPKLSDDFDTPGLGA